MESKYSFDSASKFKDIVNARLSKIAHNKIGDFKKLLSKTIFTGKKDDKEVNSSDSE